MYQSSPYAVKRPSQTYFTRIRGLQFHYRTWGTPQPGQAPLVLVHGWMDVGASFQFMVDAMAADRWIIAPDLRGFGLTKTPDADNFWFPDYIADLDTLLTALVPDQAIDLVGHSLGGHVATTYAGVRPERIRRLVNLEGFGMANTIASQAPGRYTRWLDELAQFHQGALDLKTYESVDGVVRRLRKTNPRLTEARAQWLAREWSEPTPDGRWQIRGHAAHKLISCQLFRAEETIAIYQRITAPTLFVRAEEDSLQTWWKHKFTQEEFAQRLQHIAHAETHVMHDVSHMLHHDKPEELAHLITAFLEK